jgi:hypothetical protein
LPGARGAPYRCSHRRHDGRRSIDQESEVIPMSIKSFSGVVLACVPNGQLVSAEQFVGGFGMPWYQHGSRLRPDALLTLDPTQRPSAPRRWAA